MTSAPLESTSICSSTSRSRRRSSGATEGQALSAPFSVAQGSTVLMSESGNPAWDSATIWRAARTSPAP